VQETGKGVSKAKTVTRNVTFADAKDALELFLVTVSNVFEGQWEILAEFGIMPPKPRKKRKPAVKKEEGK
jgi:hypothetical protein